MCGRRTVSPTASRRTGTAPRGRAATCRLAPSGCGPEARPRCSSGSSSTPSFRRLDRTPRRHGEGIADRDPGQAPGGGWIDGKDHDMVSIAALEKGQSLAFDVAHTRTGNDAGTLIIERMFRYINSCQPFLLALCNVPGRCGA